MDGILVGTSQRKSRLDGWMDGSQGAKGGPFTCMLLQGWMEQWAITLNAIMNLLASRTMPF